MAGGEQSSEFEVDSEQERRWQLSRRTDLANVFGIVLSMPPHGQDTEGNWEYGRVPTGGFASQQLVVEFRSDMRGLVKQNASALEANGLLMVGQAEALDAHPYSVGPAAQEWPQFFFEFYRDVRPILSDGASVLAWAYFFKDLVKSFSWWRADKQQEVDTSMAHHETSPEEWQELSLIPVFTRPALIALCYADLCKRYGIGDDVTINTYPRSFTEYMTSDHPAGCESYLIRLRAGMRTFFYLVTGNGVVAEHYLVTGSDLTLLPIPNLLGEDEAYQARQPQSSYRVRIKAKSEE